MDIHQRMCYAGLVSSEFHLMWFGYVLILGMIFIIRLGLSFDFMYYFGMDLSFDSLISYLVPCNARQTK